MHCSRCGYLGLHGCEAAGGGGAQGADPFILMENGIIYNNPAPRGAIMVRNCGNT